jgi:hypothetical protein
MLILQMFVYFTILNSSNCFDATCVGLYGPMNLDVGLLSSLFLSANYEVIFSICANYCVCVSVCGSLFMLMCPELLWAFCVTIVFFYTFTGYENTTL